MALVQAVSLTHAADSVKTIGRLLIWLGLIVFGVTAVLRRIIKPEDWANLFGHRSAVLAPMLIGIALFAIGMLMLFRSKRDSAP